MTDRILSMFNATAVSLRFPKPHADEVHRYVRQHQGGALIAEQAPFRRQLDLWAAALAIACAEGLEPKSGDPSSWGKKFVDTRSVQLDPDLATLVGVVAAAEYGIEDDRLTDPKEIMKLANRYVGSGVQVLLRWLEDPSLRQTNIEKVIREMKDLRSSTLEAAGLGSEAA